MNEPKKIDSETATSPSPPKAKKLYVSPRLIYLGDIRDLTLGGSPGIGDSGSVQPTQPSV
jgi:hypothetical protein